MLEARTCYFPLSLLLFSYLWQERWQNVWLSLKLLFLVCLPSKVWQPCPPSPLPRSRQGVTRRAGGEGGGHGAMQSHAGMLPWDEAGKLNLYSIFHPPQWHAVQGSRPSRGLPGTQGCSGSGVRASALPQDSSDAFWGAPWSTWVWRCHRDCVGGGKPPRSWGMWGRLGECFLVRCLSPSAPVVGWLSSSFPSGSGGLLPERNKFGWGAEKSVIPLAECLWDAEVLSHREVVLSTIRSCQGSCWTRRPTLGPSIISCGAGQEGFFPRH